jgi:hypothetical protein
VIPLINGGAFAAGLMATDLITNKIIKSITPYDNE